MISDRIRHYLLTSLIGVTLLLATGCSTGRVPIVAGTVPQQGELTAQEIGYGQQVYNQLASQYKIDDNLDNAARVRKIVSRLSDASAGTAGSNPWHVYIFKEDGTKNAAATRGNFIFVWTGILKAANSDAELATIIAHEISHVLAGHVVPTPGEQVNQIISGGSAQVTQAVLANSGYGGAAGILGQLTGMLFQAAIVNPSSQRIEKEADTVGLYLMAKAGYNPEGALRFWQNVSNDPAFGGGIAFLSTHPTSEERIANIWENLPEAMRIYRRR